MMRIGETVMSLTSLLLFAGTLFLMAGSPGPSIAALVSRVLSRGVRDVLPFLLAMWIGDAIWLSCAVFGLAMMAQTFHLVFTALKWLGVGYLVYLAWKMWRAPVATGRESLPNEHAPLKLFAAGLGITLGNPKIMIFYMALLPTIIDLKATGFTGWLELIATMAVVLITVDLSWAVAASQARRFLRSPRATRITNRVSAMTMAGAAVAIATR
jgi:threonine/homoserine/homoserine lactone efflux protein